MPTCNRCGASKYAFELDRNGMCEDCYRATCSSPYSNSLKSFIHCTECGIKLARCDREVGLCYDCRKKREKEQRKEILLTNLARLKDGKDVPSIQRIYDAFIKEYPDALITGIGVYGGKEKILIYLDGNPRYDATLNVLTGKADLVPYSTSSSTTTTVKSEKSYGGAIAFSVISLLYGLFLLLFSYIGGLVSIIASLVALCGCLSKSKTAIIFGAVFLLLPVVICFPYALLNVSFCLFLIALS